jgi:V/A-type H+/Na+-transporting ATPase subunit F
MSGIAVVGNRDFVLGFKLAGIRDTIVQDDIEEKVSMLLDEKEFNILVLHDEDHKNLSPALKKRIHDSVKPVVISVGKREEDDLRDKIKRVIGIDLYKK